MKKITGCLIILWLAVFIPAQEDGPVLSVEAEVPSAGWQSGKTYSLFLIINIKNPFHINSDKSGDDFTIPTKVTFEKTEGLSFGPANFPEPENKTFAFSKDPLPVFEGTIRVKVPVTVEPSFQGREADVVGKVSYQACTDIACLPPAEVGFHKKIAVAPAVEPSFPERPETAAAGAEKQKETLRKAPLKEGLSEPIGEKGMLFTFLLIFLGGLALDLTPCVYPVIPITVGYFGGQAGQRRGGVVAHAVIYVLGMAATYSALGVAAALTGNLFGAALRNPFVLIGIAVILVTLALSMFGLYEFRLPSFLTKMAGGARKGYFGTLVMGLTVGFVAAPCIGPFVLGLLTYVGEKGNVFLGFLMFFVLSLGLGLPFLFLAIFSGSINKLPRSGAWMVWVRTIFGFVLLAMAVYFLGPLFPDALVGGLALALVLLVAGIYMAWIEPTKIPGKVFPVIRNITGVVFFAASLVIAAGGIKSYIGERSTGTAAGKSSAAFENRIRWSDFSVGKLKEASELSKPVFLDFTADWCIPCKEMDAVTFVDSRVVEMSRNFVMLKVDLTHSGGTKEEKLKRMYDIRGVPTFVFLAPDGSEIRDFRTVGFIRPETLLEKMEYVLNER